MCFRNVSRHQKSLFDVKVGKRTELRPHLHLSFQDLLLYVWLFDDNRQAESARNLNFLVKSISQLKGKKCLDFSL